MKIRIAFVKQDCWVGVYWTERKFFVCIVPCLPIVIERKPARVPVDNRLVCPVCNGRRMIDNGGPVPCPANGGHCDGRMSPELITECDINYQRPGLQ